jgi:RNA polymerase sigma-70 factor (ECF subfamily)
MCSSAGEQHRYARRIGDDRDDGALVRGARDGDRQALEALLRRHYDRLYSLCRRLTGNDSDAQDATQEAMIAIVRGIERFDARSAFTTWVYRVATNAALDELRRRRRRPEPGLPAVARAEPPEGGVLDERVAARLDIDAALAALPAEFRAPVVLRDLCTLSYDEIAQVLDIPPGTVRSRIARGRAALAEALGPALAPSGEPETTVPPSNP